MKQNRPQPNRQVAHTTEKSSRFSRAACGVVSNPCAPIDLKQVSSTLTCVDISWRISFVSVISAFDVYDCTDDLDINHVLNLKTSPPASSKGAKLCGLEAGKFYTLGVRSRSKNNNVSSVVTLRVHTKHLAPPVPDTPLVCWVGVRVGVGWGGVG
ncbi:hypothetical protein ACOMHN_060325 [Nucella lapillus]